MRGIFSTLYCGIVVYSAYWYLYSQISSIWLDACTRGGSEDNGYSVSNVDRHRRMRNSRRTEQKCNTLYILCRYRGELSGNRHRISSLSNTLNTNTWNDYASNQFNLQAHNITDQGWKESPPCSGKSFQLMTRFNSLRSQSIFAYTDAYLPPYQHRYRPNNIARLASTCLP